MQLVKDGRLFFFINGPANPDSPCAERPSEFDTPPEERRHETDGHRSESGRPQPRWADVDDERNDVRRNDRPNPIDDRIEDAEVDVLSPSVVSAARLRLEAERRCALSAGALVPVSSRSAS